MIKVHVYANREGGEKKKKKRSLYVGMSIDKDTHCGSTNKANEIQATTKVLDLVLK